LARYDIDYKDAQKSIDLGQPVWVGVPWKGVDEAGHKEEWCKKGKLTQILPTECVVSLENGGVLTAKKTILKPWHESLSNRRRTHK
jgi:hypothetical protein